MIFATTPSLGRCIALAAMGCATFLPTASVSATGDTAADAYREMGLATKDVLSGTSLNAKVIPGERKQFVSLTTYFTGKGRNQEAVNVRLDIFERNGKAFTSIYHRDFGDENGGFVGDGNLQVIDLDMDGVNEIIVSYENYEDPLIQQEEVEVLLWNDGVFEAGWTGLLSYDATRAARGVPAERRDHYIRELDLPSTLRSRGKTLYVTKHMIAVAGEKLPRPKSVPETYPLRSN